MVLSQLIQKRGNSESKVFVLFSPFDTYEWLPIITALPTRLNDYLARAQSSKNNFTRRLLDYRNLMPFYPMLTWLLRRKVRQHKAQWLVVSSFAAVKNIVSPGIASETILYLHSPMQYIWENYDEYCMKLSGLKKRIFITVSHYLRRRDKRTKTYDTIYANSVYTAQCAKVRYQWESITVLYPTLPDSYRTTSPHAQPHDYYLYIGRLVSFVRETDTIIKLCTELNIPLLVVGTWPDEDYLKSIAWPTITFLGLITDDDKKIRLLKQAKGLINIAKESLGIVTMESLAVWTPVFWYNAWGTKELVFNDSLWVLVDEKNPEQLEQGIQKFIMSSFDRETIKQQFFSYYDNVGSII